LRTQPFKARKGELHRGFVITRVVLVVNRQLFQGFKGQQGRSPRKFQPLLHSQFVLALPLELQGQLV
jgi:hypothetical protein